MLWLWIVLAVCALCILVLLIGGVRLRPRSMQPHAPYRTAVDEPAALERFGKLIRLRTVWPREGGIDYSQFDAFLPTLRALFPGMMGTLELHTIRDYGLLLRWKGTKHSSDEFEAKENVAGEE